METFCKRLNAVPIDDSNNLSFRFSLAAVCSEMAMFAARNTNQPIGKILREEYVVLKDIYHSLQFEMGDLGHAKETAVTSITRIKSGLQSVSVTAFTEPTPSNSLQANPG